MAGRKNSLTPSFSSFEDGAQDGGAQCIRPPGARALSPDGHSSWWSHAFLPVAWPGFGRPVGAESGKLWWVPLRSSIQRDMPSRLSGETGSTLPELRSRIDRDPVQAYLATQYPVAGRSTFQRQQVVAVYRRAKRFFRILEHWKAAEHGEITKAFSVGAGSPYLRLFSSSLPNRTSRFGSAHDGRHRASVGERGTAGVRWLPDSFF